MKSLDEKISAAMISNIATQNNSSTEDAAKKYDEAKSVLASEFGVGVEKVDEILVKEGIITKGDK